MSLISRRVTEYQFTLHTAATALATPSGASAGGAVPAAYTAVGFGTGGGAPRKWLIKIDGSTTIALTNAILCRYDAVDAVWRQVAILVATINLESGLGYEAIVEDVGGGSRYALKGTLSAGNVTVQMLPMDTY
jgi:hypothetical protein